MKALILGATGLVGHSLWRDWKARGWDVSGTYCRHAVEGLVPLDMRDAAAVEACFDRFRPEAVVIASANPYVDYCETHAEETAGLNVRATTQAAEIAGRRKVKAVFFSSEYVFPGRKEPYDEAAAVEPLSEYGRQKAAVEQWMRSHVADYLVLRVAGVYGWALPFNRTNYVMQILDRANSALPDVSLPAGGRRRDEVRKGGAARGGQDAFLAATDVLYTPTYAADLGPVLAELLEKNVCGLYHAAGTKALSRYEFAMEAADAFGLDRNIIQPVTFAAFYSARPAKRPQYASLATGELRKIIQARLRAPRQALEHMKSTERDWTEPHRTP